MSLKIVKETGLQSSYEELITELAECDNFPDDPFEYAAAFFLNCDKKKQTQLRKIQASYHADPVPESLRNPHSVEEGEEQTTKKKGRRVGKIALKSKVNAPPPIPRVTPSMFEVTGQKPRPVITSVKKEKINYGYVDIVTKQEVVVETMLQKDDGEYKITEPQADQAATAQEDVAIESAEARFQSHDPCPAEEEEKIAEALDDEPLPPE